MKAEKMRTVLGMFNEPVMPEYLRNEATERLLQQETFESIPKKWMVEVIKHYYSETQRLRGDQTGDDAQ